MSISSSSSPPTTYISGAHIQAYAWSEFARNESGEWDSHGADFTTGGDSIELPKNVVPEAYKEWEVKVFDWQTQCPTLADPEKHSLMYKAIKLLPTVACEADSPTRYTIDERRTGNGVLGISRMGPMLQFGLFLIWVW